MNTSFNIDAKSPSLSNIGDDAEILVLDEDTQIDLHLFGSDSGSQANSLFNFCNRCRSEGGKKTLRRRMESPWSSANRIRATQKSLLFILQHRAAVLEEATSGPDLSFA